jgi:hypothetical protein
MTSNSGESLEQRRILSRKGPRSIMCQYLTWVSHLGNTPYTGHNPWIPSRYPATRIMRIQTSLLFYPHQIKQVPDPLIEMTFRWWPDVRNVSRATITSQTPELVCYLAFKWSSKPEHYWGTTDCFPLINNSNVSSRLGNVGLLCRSQSMTTLFPFTW